MPCQYANLSPASVCQILIHYSQTEIVPFTPLLSAWRFFGWYATQVTTPPSWAGTSETTFPLTKSHVNNLPFSLPLRTYLSACPKHDRIRYSVLTWPLKVCNSPPFALSNNRIVESNVDTNVQLLSSDCQTEVMGWPITSVDNWPARKSYVRNLPSTEPVMISKFLINTDVTLSLASSNTWIGVRFWDLQIRHDENEKSTLHPIVEQ